MKISTETIQGTLLQKGHEPQEVERLLKEMEERAAAEAEAEKAERAPTVKKQFVVILSDPAGVIPQGNEFVGWVAQIPEDESILETEHKLVLASYEYNISKKGRKYPVRTIGEACEAVGPRFLKEQDLWIKTKIPVSILISDNKIPEIEDDFGQ